MDLSRDKEFGFMFWKLLKLRPQRQKNSEGSEGQKTTITWRTKFHTVL